MIIVRRNYNHSPKENQCAWALYSCSTTQSNNVQRSTLPGDLARGLGKDKSTFCHLKQEFITSVIQTNRLFLTAVYQTKSRCEA